MSCMCGDLYCPSCGPAQGNSKCPACGKWTGDGGCNNPEACGLIVAAAVEAEYRQWIEMEKAAEAWAANRHPTADDETAPEGFTDQF